MTDGWLHVGSQRGPLGCTVFGVGERLWYVTLFAPRVTVTLTSAGVKLGKNIMPPQLPPAAQSFPNVVPCELTEIVHGPGGAPSRFTWSPLSQPMSVHASVPGNEHEFASASMPQSNERRSVITWFNLCGRPRGHLSSIPGRDIDASRTA